MGRLQSVYVNLRSPWRTRQQRQADVAWAKPAAERAKLMATLLDHAESYFVHPDLVVTSPVPGAHAKPAGARKPSRRAAFVGCLLLLACDKHERCFLGAAEPRCEGDVLLHCPGGWLGGFSLDLQKQDCSLQGQSCRSLAPEGNWTGCVTVLGRCDPETFQPFCHAQGPVRCERGEQWVTPGECGAN